MKIGVEGSRKDQNSDLGARKFAEAAYELLFHQRPPLNLPYDFCYVRSENSPQINRFGVSVDTALKFLPPQLFFDLLTKLRNTQVIEIDLEGEQMLEVYKDYAKRTFEDKNGILFKKMLDAARYDVWKDTDSKQGEFIQCLKHYLNTSHVTNSWSLDLSKKPISNEERIFFTAFKKNLSEIIDWKASDIQQMFNKTIDQTKIDIKYVCMAVYQRFLNRQTGPRIGLLFEKIGKDRLLKYLKIW
jgi:lysyl-tRNA synthetase class I